MTEPSEITESPQVTEPSEKPELPRAQDVTSAAFWKKRLARMLVVGALVLAVSQLLPTLPEDQPLEIVAPQHASLHRVRVTYFEIGSREPLGGTEITPSEPTKRLPHQLRLPNGDYTFSIVAHGTDEQGATRRWDWERRVTLSGARASLNLGR